jgi:heavy metal sensor kinase
MKRLSLRLRLTLWYTLALVVVLALGAADVSWVQGRLGLRRIDRELDATTATLANVVRSEIGEGAPMAEAAAEAQRTVAAPDRAVAIVGADGRVLAADWNGFAPPDTLLQGSAEAAATTGTRSGSWRVHVKRQRFDRGGEVRLVTASPLAQVDREQRQLRQAMLVGIPLALLVAAFGGLWLATVGLRPLTEMASQAAELPLTGSEDLGGEDRTDEIGQLARAFNGLLARLRAALRTQRQFMADASHELRTPVSVIRTAADIALSRERRSEAEYRETLTIITSEGERLSRLVADMLVLARADAGGYPLRPVDLYLDEIVAECRRAVDVLAVKRGVSVRVGRAPEIPFRGDEDLLRQLILNVLQNAVQHTPAGGVVSIDVGRDDGRISIRVADGGTGIALADRERIFDRFVQLDAARRGAGTGLGLPIARWIAEAHAGTLVLEESGPGGSRFCVSLPAQ